jgi:hypothetical protein
MALSKRERLRQAWNEAVAAYEDDPSPINQRVVDKLRDEYLDVIHEPIGEEYIAQQNGEAHDRARG